MKDFLKRLKLNLKMIRGGGSPATDTLYANHEFFERQVPYLVHYWEHHSHDYTCEKVTADYAGNIMLIDDVACTCGFEPVPEFSLEPWKPKP